MRKIRLIMILALLASGAACSSKPSGNSLEATIQAMSVSIALTATANASDKGGGSVDDLATAQAEATRRSAEIQATRTSSASEQNISQQAQATASGPVVGELPVYGVDPAKGRLGWVHEPVDMKIDGYHQYAYANDHMEVVAKDFVMASDITWDTQYGASGCGFMLRSDGDKNKPSQYMLIMTRFGNGHILFSALADGEIANVRDYYPASKDKSFKPENGATNRLAVVGRGNLIEIYTNGVKIGEVDTTQPPPSLSLPAKPQVPADLSNLDILKKYQDQMKDFNSQVSQLQSNYQLAVKNFSTKKAVFDQGFMAMIGVSESGHTECKFDNAWLWLIEP